MNAAASSPFGRLLRLAAKEQKEILRDRRTLLTLVVMPLLLYPLVGLVIQQFMTAVAPRAPLYIVGVPDPREAQFIDQLLQIPDAVARKKPSPADPPAELQYAVESPEELQRRLRDGRIDVLIRMRGVPAVKVEDPVALDLSFVTVRGRRLSEEAGRYLKNRLETASRIILESRLNFLHVRQRPDPIRIESLFESPSRKEGFPLGAVAPFMLILMTITGAVYPAIDLTAGERERGTLEMLMAAPVPRMSILIAKYSAVLTVALLTAIVNLGAMAATLYLTDVGRLVVGEGGLSAKTVAQGFAALVLFVCFFSALLLALASFARSFKEAQAYLIPLMLVALAPGVVSLFPGVELTAASAAAPLLNIVLFARDLLQSDVDGWLTAVVLVTNACYAAAALALAARLFGSEGVLYGGAGSWTGLVRRPSGPRPFVPVSTALFLAGLALPFFVLLNGAGRLAFPNNMVGQMLAGAVVLVIVFVAAPISAAWNRNVPARRAFALFRPPLLGLAAALLFGLSLWPFALLLSQTSRSAEILKDHPELAERLKALAEEIQGIPLSARIALLAVIPAVCEELFFRGFLFGALIRQARANTVFVTSVLFAIFHVISPSGLTPDRFMPSLFLGAFLGLLRWRSGSVWPGVLMHIAHNSVLLTALDAPERFGFAKSADGAISVPPLLYAGAAAATAVALGLLALAPRRPSIDHLENNPSPRRGGG